MPNGRFGSAELWRSSPDAERGAILIGDDASVVSFLIFHVIFKLMCREDFIMFRYSVSKLHLHVVDQSLTMK